jgi:hypothetical protein
LILFKKAPLSGAFLCPYECTVYGFCGNNLSNCNVHNVLLRESGQEPGRNEDSTDGRRLFLFLLR